jgi:hypothetical protein
MDLKEIGWEGVDWIYLAQDSLLWRVFLEHGDKASGSTKGGQYFD